MCRVIRVIHSRASFVHNVISSFPALGRAIVIVPRLGKVVFFVVVVSNSLCEWWPLREKKNNLCFSIHFNSFVAHQVVALKQRKEADQVPLVFHWGANSIGWSTIPHDNYPRCHLHLHRPRVIMFVSIRWVPCSVCLWWQWFVCVIGHVAGDKVITYLPMNERNVVHHRIVIIAVNIIITTTRAFAQTSTIASLEMRTTRSPPTKTTWRVLK